MAEAMISQVVPERGPVGVTRKQITVPSWDRLSIKVLGWKWDELLYAVKDPHSPRSHHSFIHL